MQTPLTDAIHEAAHAVVVLALGGTVRGVDIEHEDGRAGLTRYVHSGSLVEQIAIGISGTIAEWEHRRRRGLKINGGAIQDVAEIHVLLKKHLGPNCPHRDQVPQYIEGERLAKDIVGKHWGAVKRIAERLVTHTEVSGPLCQAIFLSHRQQEQEYAQSH